MISEGQTLIISMYTTCVGFVSDVIADLWPYFLTIGVIAFAVRFILGKLGFGQR